MAWIKKRIHNPKAICSSNFFWSCGPSCGHKNLNFDCFCCMLLTHICRVDPSVLINWTSPFPIFVESGVLFHFYSISNRYSCQQTVKTLIRRLRNPEASDLGLHCLHMSQKWDARLEWVNVRPVWLTDWGLPSQYTQLWLYQDVAFQYTGKPALRDHPRGPWKVVSKYRWPLN